MFTRSQVATPLVNGKKLTLRLIATPGNKAKGAVFSPAHINYIRKATLLTTI